MGLEQGASMKKLLAAFLVASIFVSGVAAGQSLLVPNGRFTANILARLEYDPSPACIKPIQPYTDDPISNQIFIDAAKQYVRCMDAVAKSDAEFAVRVVMAGRDKAMEEYRRELKR